MALTASDGSLHLLGFLSDFTEMESLNESDPLQIHSIGPAGLEQPMQAWCGSWVTWKGSTSILTGGDDSKIRHVSILHPVPNRVGTHLEAIVNTAAYRTVFQHHDYGVTAILPLPSPDELSDIPPLILTGSYDDHVKLLGRENFPKKTTGFPKVLSELDLGGGVWKLKLISHEFGGSGEVVFKYLVLASCVSKHHESNIVYLCLPHFSDVCWR
jgi:hypothetical protein